MRYVIIGNERKQCRAKDPDHCRYHKGITHYKTKDAADKALDMEMNKNSQKRLKKTSSHERYSPKQSMAARYEDLREVDDSEVGWSEDDATKYDEKTQRQPVGLNMNDMHIERFIDFSVKNLKNVLVGKRIDDVKNANDDVSFSVLMEDKTRYDFSNTYDAYDGFYYGFYHTDLKSFNNNGEPVTDIIKTTLPLPNNDEEDEELDDVYDITIMTKDGPIMRFNVSGGYQCEGNGPDVYENKPNPYFMACGQKVTRITESSHLGNPSDSIDDYFCRAQLQRREEGDPSTAIAAKMRISNCDINGKKTPVVTEFLIEPKDGDGTPIVKNVETVLPNGERVRNKTITDSVNSIMLDKQGLDDSVTNTLYNASKNNENVEIRAIGFYNTKE